MDVNGAVTEMTTAHGVGTSETTGAPVNVEDEVTEAAIAPNVGSFENAVTRVQTTNFDDAHYRHSELLLNAK